VAPGKILFEDSLYKMWYTGTNANGFQQIGYATSTDGIHWVKHFKNPVLAVGLNNEWDSKVISEASVIKNEDQYLIWYLGYNGFNERYQIGFATSLDGVNWEKYTSNPVLTYSATGWDDRGVAHPMVLKINNIYHMWYSAISFLSIFPRWRIGFATSTDGIHWNKYSKNPILISDQPWEFNKGDGTSGPNVLYDGNLFHMWYHVPGIGYAVSYDGTTWFKYPNNPVLSLGNNFEWDSFFIGGQNVIYDNKEYKMYYAGASEGDNYKIGLAISETLPYISLPTITPSLTPVSSPTTSLSPTPTLNITVIPTYTPTQTPSMTSTPTFSPTPTVPLFSPIVIVPGLGASINWNDLFSCNLSNSNNWESMPFYTAKIYDPIMTILASEIKLVRDKDFYFYTYDWRQPLNKLGDNFKKYINKISQKHLPGTKFRMIGHSLGGLVLRNYVFNNPDHKALAILTAGTPHKGTLDSYPLWENGDTKWIANIPAKTLIKILLLNCKLKLTKSQNNNTFQEIDLNKLNLLTSDREIVQNNVPVIKQLLPVFNFIKKEETTINFIEMFEKNNWIIDHPFPISVGYPYVYSISGINNKTLQYFVVTDASKKDANIGNWIDGKPKKVETVLEGDGTVLRDSSIIPGINHNIEIEGDHLDVIASKKAIKYILAYLKYFNVQIDEAPELLNFSDQQLLSIILEKNGSMVLTDNISESISERNMLVKINPKKGIYKLNILPEETSDSLLFLLLSSREEDINFKTYKLKLKKNSSLQFELTYDDTNFNKIKLKSINY